jgi:hypothetical protein
MSAFDDFNDSAFDEAAAVIGTDSFTISNVAYTGGILDEFTASREVEIGGMMGSYDGTLMVKLTNVSNITAPIERSVEGKVIVISGRSFRVEKAATDSLTLTMGLANLNKTK